MTDSFTVSLGTHIQYQYQLRVSVGRLADSVRHAADPLERSALRAQTMATLFGDRRVALVQYVTAGEWQRYRAGRLNEIVYRSCYYETEQVFDSLE